MVPRYSLVAAAVLLVTTAGAAQAQVDQAKAAGYFKEAAQLCAQDAGKLWGISLCGPIVIADATTGTIATNQQAPDAPRPRAVGFANAALMWGDTRWTTIVWQLIPEDLQRRRRMFAHELFHRVQFQLKLMANDGDNSHLDTLEGRYFIQLEWRALDAAVATAGPARATAIADAVAFRAARFSRFPNAADAERRLMLNEGLAQYTGTVLAAATRADAVRDVRQQLVEATSTETFVRTFPYSLGAAYGLLLDDAQPGWPRSMRADGDVVSMLTSAAGIAATTRLAEAEARYDGAALRAAEVARDRDRQARLADLTRRFVDGPVLVVPAGRNAAFITAGLTPLPGHGIVYQQYQVAGEWGSLDTKAVLVSTDRTTLILAGPFNRDGSVLTGEGWTVTLAQGWTVEPSQKAGSFRLVKQ